MIKSDLPIVDPSAWEEDQAPLDRRNAGHVKSKSRANMWYEAWYEPFSLFGKCEKWPFLLVAGEGHATTSFLAAKSNKFNSLIATGVRI